MSDLIHNAYDRPALLDVVGSDLVGLQVLDAGGGVGKLSVELLRRRATVHLCDVDLLACEAADHVLSRWVEVMCVDLQLTPWPYADESFDVVVLSLVLDLVETLDSLSEIRRVLAPGGRCVVSVRHPGGYQRGNSDRRDEMVKTESSTTQRTWYARSFAVWLNVFDAAGLHVRRCVEPIPPNGGDPWVVIFELTRFRVGH